MILKLKIKLALLISVIIIFSCKGQTFERKKPKTEPSFVEENDLNDSLVVEIGTFIENAILTGESNDFMTKLDLDRFNQLATYTEKDNKEIQDYRKGFIDGFSKSISALPDKITATVNQGGFYDFLKYYYDPDTNSYGMLFRLFSEEEGINYHDYKLIKPEDDFFIQDIYIYLTGENLSDTTNKIYLTFMPKNLFGKIISGDNSEDMSHLLSAIKNKKIGKNNMALDDLTKISGELKQTKIYHVMKNMVASNLDDATYMKAMIEMLEVFPDDPTCHLLSIDYYIMKADLERAINAINLLEKQTGDTFLNFLRGNTAFSMEKYDVAANYFVKLLEDYPSYDTGRFSLITCYSILENHDKCIVMLNDILEEEFYTLSDLIDFVESEEEDGTNQLISLATSETYLNWKTEQQE